MLGRSNRKDIASKIVKTPPHAVYRAFMDPEALVAWLPPQGMQAGLTHSMPGKAALNATYMPDNSVADQAKEK
ncbi:hypothetical protein BBD40_22450 [Paenibacillus ihbetae]|uniref:ATPase n=1 Tax=Paenibacillus ihbetae TaxID=1870820 RepID=A0ABX3JR02_9BACL|nr:hypothetical protein BBD40_22450 [Paenibacillus ihbetae]